VLTCFCFSGGVNSTALALEIARGEYRSPDVAMNLPTDADDATTRQGVKDATELLRAAGVPVIEAAPATILADDAQRAALGKARSLDYQPLCPWWYGRDTDPRRALRRQCTRYYKTRPLRRILRTIAGIHDRAGHVRAPIAEFWLGFSTDEPMRARQPGPRWLRHRFPLIELDYSRADCRAILDADGYHHIIRSSCLHCPYRTDADWAAMRYWNPDAYARACLHDEAIRLSSPRLGPLYLHRSRRPLHAAVADYHDPDPNHRGT